MFSLSLEAGEKTYILYKSCQLETTNEWTNEQNNWRNKNKNRNLRVFKNWYMIICDLTNEMNEKKNYLISSEGEFSPLKYEMIKMNHQKNNRIQQRNEWRKNTTK